MVQQGVCKSTGRACVIGLPFMKVEIDEQSGFCFGVVRAINEAEGALQNGSVASLGDIVHNRVEVQRLENLGLHTISHEDIPSMAGKRMLIRAHGEPPKTYALAKEYGIEVIDATCPVVAALQRKVKSAYDKMCEVNGSVVIFGKRGHAEVVGLIGQVDEKAIVVECEEDLEQVDFSRPIYFLSQTTQSIEKFTRLASVMRERLASEDMLTVDDTICRRVSSREEHLREFARQHDIIIFVCGRKSSNGKVLYNICRQANERSYNIEEASELQREWFDGAESIGICGATSTPKWLMQDIAEAIACLN